MEFSKAKLKSIRDKLLLVLDHFGQENGLYYMFQLKKF
jgi:hypothetical protein